MLLLMRVPREFRAMNATIQSLQEQVDNLYSNLSALRTSQETNGLLQQQGPPYPRLPSLTHSPTSQPPYQSSISPRGKHPRFQGPTSSAFNFDVANSSLQTMGITDVDIPRGKLARLPLPEAISRCAHGGSTSP